MPRVAKDQPQPPNPETEKLLARLQITFGANVREWRHERLLTQEQVAERAGLHVNYISSVERGERNVSLFNIWRIATALDLTVPELTMCLVFRPAGNNHQTTVRTLE